MQIIPAPLAALIDADVQPNSWGARVSFTKAYDDDVIFFTLNTSVLDGTDVLAPTEDNPLQQWDKYDYSDYTDRATMMSWKRVLDFPSSVASAIADFEFDNHDGYFTPGSGSPIDAYILPKRPVRLLSGLGGVNLPQFVGLTEGMPEINESSKTVTFTAIDFLTQINDMDITQTIAMQDVRTDEVLAVIFDMFGLSPSQYNLAKGSNIIPFLFFEQGTITAGKVIKQLMEAEAGLLWLTEDGIIRFEPRLALASDPVMELDGHNIIDIKTNSDSKIINKIKIYSEIREVQPYQVVYTKEASSGELFVIAAGETRIFQAQLEDPLIAAVAPTNGEASAVSWYTAKNSADELIATSISVDATVIRTNTYDITFTNSNSFDIEIAEMEIYGEPARVIDRINYIAFDQPSIDKYEENLLEIENNFIQSVIQCETLCAIIIDQYKEHSSIVEMTIKGNPALQLSDVVSVDYEQYNNQYQLISVENKLSDGMYTQIIQGRHYQPRIWFVLDSSELNSDAVLAP